MKKYILGFVLGLSLVACNNKDSIWINAMGDVDSRLYYLEQLCQQMNTNISSLQTIVNSLETGDYIVSVTPINQDNKVIGYTIVFAKSGSITIYNGTDGQDGKDGQDGQDGQDGSTPIIGAAQDTDGVYYWTVNGSWLLDANGNKIRVTGNDGANGQNGQNGITPQLKIENGMWYVSYDNGTNWTLVGQAIGATGPAGQNGDSMFQSVTYDDDYVYFTLANGTVIKVARNASAYTGPIINNGAVMAAYSVSATRQVYFSMGNLQYQASTDTWRFALHQYDYVGSDNLNASSTYSGWIDLFGWATSGYYDAYTASQAQTYCQCSLHYQPWDMTQGGTVYCGYGPMLQGVSLKDYYANFDWGFYNAISNGGNQTRQWRTMEDQEWDYVLHHRGIASITATVNNIQGLLLRPDNYSTTVDSLLRSIVPSGDYSAGVTMDTLKWQALQNEGCIFLPNAGYRSYHSSQQYNSGVAHYWSINSPNNANSGATSAYSANALTYGDISISSGCAINRSYGLAVRVVKDVKQ